MVARRTSWCWRASVLLLLLASQPAVAQAPPMADGQVAEDDAGPGTTARPSDALRTLGTIRRLGRFDDSATLADLADHPDSLVRAEVCRVLAVHPELGVDDVLARLAGDSSPQVVALALISLSRSPSPDAIGVLETQLASADSSRRELAAIGLLLREAVAAEDDLEAPSQSLLTRSRLQIVSPQGRSWLAAIEHYERLRRTRMAWLELQERLLALERGRSAVQDTGRCSARCAAQARANPALVLPATDADDPAVQTQPLRWPDAALLRGPGEGPAALLASGRHDDLSEALFETAEEVARLEHFVTRLEAFCSGEPGDAAGAAQPPVTPAGPGAPVLATGGRTGDLGGIVGVGLGINSNPLAYRDGAGDFLLGEDFELTLVPELRLAYTYAGDRMEAGEATRVPPIVDGLGFEIGLGGVFDTAFFEDRSRPTGWLAMVHDRPVAPAQGAHHRARQLRLRAVGELWAGMGEDQRDVAVFPAPHVSTEVGVDYRRSVGAVPGPEQDARVDGRIAYVQYALDDSNAPPRDRRWLEPSADGMMLLGAPSDLLRLGLTAHGSARTNSAISGLSAAVIAGAPLMRWRERGLVVDLWLGAGGGFFPAVEPKVDPFAALIGGLRARYQGGIEPFQWAFSVGLERDVAVLGRNGYGGITERAEASIDFGLPAAVRDALRLVLFAERTTPEDTGDRTGWGGVETFIPVGLSTWSQQITYRMRIMALVDEARFSSRSQAVFESMLWAGSWF